MLLVCVLQKYYLFTNRQAVFHLFFKFFSILLINRIKNVLFMTNNLEFYT